jgi:hypothetical protein
MMKSCVREFGWEPRILGSLYFDEEDHEGLYFWYNDIDEVHKDLKRKESEKNEQ